MESRLTLSELVRMVSVRLTRDDWSHVHNAVGRVPLSRFPHPLSVERAWCEIGRTLNATPPGALAVTVTAPLGHLLAFSEAASDGALRRTRPLEWQAARLLAQRVNALLPEGAGP